MILVFRLFTTSAAISLLVDAIVLPFRRGPCKEKEESSAMDHTPLGFKETPTDDVVEYTSCSSKRMPWLRCEEWRFVRESLFSSSPDLVASALDRIWTWRLGGFVPVAVEVTASIIEIQQTDPFFRHDLNESAGPSEEVLTMSYCMAIMRLVNGIIEKTRKKYEISIGEAADAIGIPRMLIDIRHEGSHRDLPSLRLVRCASKKALDWLISYYWEPQEKAIFNLNIQKENLKKEIKHRLQEVALCQNATKARKSSLERKRFKKQRTKLLKNVIRLYSSCSTEVTHILLEFLLDAVDSSNLTEHLEDSHIYHGTENKQTAYDDWKSTVLKLSRREPEFLAMLADTILEKMEAQEAMNFKSGEHQSRENSLKSRRFELHLCVFEWLLPHLMMLTTVGHQESSEIQDFLAEELKVILAGLLRRCLLISSPENKQLMRPALIIAHQIGNPSLLHKLEKLPSLGLSDLAPNSDPPGDVIPLSSQKDALLLAEEKFELMKRYRIEGKATRRKESDLRPGRRWKTAKSWNCCGIGNLPSSTGSLGRIPSLDWTDKISEVSKLSDNKECSQLKQCNKRKGETAIQDLDDSDIKKVKETKPDCESYVTGHVNSEGIKGHMMIDGIWKKVGEEEFLAIASAVRLLV